MSGLHNIYKLSTNVKCYCVYILHNKHSVHAFEMHTSVQDCRFAPVSFRNIASVTPPMIGPVCAGCTATLHTHVP